ncbi:MAG: hypothetical protein RL026_2134 [Pseudomonadota bacterium]|jgi:hypothetical protein
MSTMIKKSALLALGLMGSLAAQSALACKAPAAPRSVPEGRSADLQTMLGAKAEVEQYMEQVNAYFNCEGDALKLQEVSAQQHAVISHFKAEVQAFRAASRAPGTRPASFVR